MDNKIYNFHKNSTHKSTALLFLLFSAFIPLLIMKYSYYINLTGDLTNKTTSMLLGQDKKTVDISGVKIIPLKNKEISFSYFNDKNKSYPSTMVEYIIQQKEKIKSVMINGNKIPTDKKTIEYVFNEENLENKNITVIISYKK